MELFVTIFNVFKVPIVNKNPVLDIDRGNELTSDITRKLWK